jgi:hypothetical protein
MAGTKLIDDLKQEISHYIGIPYWKNTLKDGKIIKEGFMGGKGNCKEIALKTVELANNQNIKLLDLTPQQIYNFQKKNKIGIDCSGFAGNLLNFYIKLQNKCIPFENLRKISADMLTSSPISNPIKSLDDIQTGDLIRSKNGHHVQFIIEKIGNIIFYVESKLSRRGVHYGEITITPKNKKNLLSSIFHPLFLD